MELLEECMPALSIIIQIAPRGVPRYSNAIGVCYSTKLG